MDTEILIPAFIVIVIGGMGSLRGAFAGSLLIGIADTFGKAYFQSIALFLIYLAMLVVLLIRPQGLFGIKYSDVAIAPAVSATSLPATVRTAHRGSSRCSCCVALPFALSDYPRALVAEIFIFAIFAMSLDLLLGFTGLMSLGHAAFFGLGAYAVAVLGAQFGLNAWLGVVAGIGIAAAGAALIGFFCVRTGGIPFLMLTLAFSQLLFTVALKWRDVTGGSDGIAVPEQPGFLGFDLSNSLVMYFMALGFFVLVYWALRRLLNAPLGHVFVGIRENETRMQAIGYRDPRLQAVVLHHRRRRGRPRWRPLRHLQRLHFQRCAVLDRLRRHPDHDHARRRRHAGRAGARHRRVPADEECRQLLQRTLARHYRAYLHLLRDVLPRRHLGYAAKPAIGSWRACHDCAAHRASQQGVRQSGRHRRLQSRSSPGRAPRHHRSERRRQDQPDQSDRRPARAQLRPHLPERSGHHRLRAGAHQSAKAWPALSSATTCS